MYTIYLHILTAMVFAAFFSGVETAFASASKMRFQLDTHRQGLISKLLALYYRHPDDFVTALLTGYHRWSSTASLWHKLSKAGCRRRSRHIPVSSCSSKS